MANLDKTVTYMIRKFERRASLDESDRHAVATLPYRLRTIEPHQYMVREGMAVTESCLVLSGLAYRQKATIDGARQILSVNIPGDFVDLEGSLLRTADHNVQALTRCEVALVPVQKIVALIDSHPRVGRAMWLDTLIDASIFREWIVNVGQRDARSRVAHLFCEFARRLEVAGLGSVEGYEFPMTQEQLADATGLTPVHVNRTLKALEADGLISRQKRFVHISDWDGLRNVGGFNESYLHLDQMAA